MTVVCVKELVGAGWLDFYVVVRYSRIYNTPYRSRLFGASDASELSVSRHNNCHMMASHGYTGVAVVSLYRHAFGCRGH